MHWSMISLIRYILSSVFSTSFVGFMQFSRSPRTDVFMYVSFPGVFLCMGA